MAWWQSGYAADCKSVDAGSIPTQASIFLTKKINKIDHGLAASLPITLSRKTEILPHLTSRGELFPFPFRMQCSVITNDWRPILALCLSNISCHSSLSVQRWIKDHGIANPECCRGANLNPSCSVKAIVAELSSGVKLDTCDG